MAVQRSLGWAAVKMSDQMTGKRNKIIERRKAEIPCGLEKTLNSLSL